MGKSKIRVAVVYGGRSGEHEVSLQSAASVIRNLDPERFEVIPVSVDKQGRWLMGDVKLIGTGKALPVFKDQAPVVLPPNPSSTTALLPLGGGASEKAIDVVFPVIHGTLGEDGTIQGLFELAEVPYVGCGILASSVGMDKDVAKRLARDAGIPIVPFVTIKQSQWKRDRAQLREHCARELGYPLFVKPANSGSSVGVHKVKEAAQFDAAVEDAFKYDTKLLVEAGIDAREIEVSVLENIDPTEGPLASIPGEIEPTHEFYSYDSKYLDENGARLSIPAKLSADEIKRVQDIARATFVALECEGMARVDFFLDRKSGAFYLNEINTIPGFTSISMYPKMWEASGLPYKELLTKLVELAIARHERRKKLSREYVP